MTKTEQRVALAKDVIKQLTKKELRAVKGEYVSGPLSKAARQLNDISEYSESGFIYLNENLDMRDLINNQLKAKTCTVCVKGALFLAHILRNDKVTLDEFINVELGNLRDKEASCPIPAFTPRQLDEIEMLYESDGFFRGRVINWSDNDIKKFKTIRKRLPSKPDERLKAIMRRIIKNKGRSII